MKLSEKTLELNICAQMSQFVGAKQRLFWFGLTQKQEARDWVRRMYKARWSAVGVSVQGIQPRF